MFDIHSIRLLEWYCECLIPLKHDYSIQLNERYHLLVWLWAEASVGEKKLDHFNSWTNQSWFYILCNSIRLLRGSWNNFKNFKLILECEILVLCWTNSCGMPLKYIIYDSSDSWNKRKLNWELKIMKILQMTRTAKNSSFDSWQLLGDEFFMSLAPPSNSWLSI